MAKHIIRIVLNEDTFRKYKVFCAIANRTMTHQTNLIVSKFVEESNKEIKIITTELSENKDKSE